MKKFTLDKLEVGQAAVITCLNAVGADRRRLMDLGLLPGTRLQAEHRSPLGDPVAYRVRDTLIALRRSQAREVEIEPLEGSQP